MESLGKPASTPSPSLVVFIGVEVCRSHGRDDQIDRLAPNLANICIPNDLASWPTLGAKSSQVVCLDAILLHRDWRGLAAKTADVSSATVGHIATCRNLATNF